MVPVKQPVFHGKYPSLEAWKQRCSFFVVRFMASELSSRTSALRILPIYLSRMQDLRPDPMTWGWDFTQKTFPSLGRGELIFRDKCP